MEDKLNNKIDKLADKIDKLDDRLDVIDKHLAVYNVQLEIHIKRTKELEDRHVPVEEHVKNMNGAGKLVALSATIIGVLIGLLKILGIIP